MNRRNRRQRGSSKHHQRPSPSEQRSQPSSSKPPRLLPPSLEKNWTADEVWALMSHTESSGYQYSDTPEYWNSIAALIPGSTADNLRKIHMAIFKYQEKVSLWDLDDLRTLIASFYGNMIEPIDKPEWWAEIASNFPKKTALDCRLAYNTFCMSDSIPEDFFEDQPQEDATTQPSGTGSTKTDAASISEQGTSAESPMTTSEGEQQQPTTFPGGASSQRTSVVPLPNWTLEDYMSLMTILTKNLHVDTEDAGAMEGIALQMGGKRGEEVRHLILKWRPQLLAALEKADRIAGSSSGTKEPATSR